MIEALDFSRFEFCPRLPSINRLIQPLQLPIREAVRRYFLNGVKSFYGNDPDPWDAIPQAFLVEAAEVGYEYPKGEPYVIAQDHACWLEGALHLLPAIDLQPIPAIKLDDEYIAVDGYVQNGGAHLFRVLDSFDEKVRWPEILLLENYDPVTIHTFRLPRVSSRGRLLSPASMAYAHPISKEMRLARLEGEGKAFTSSWKQIARWEMADVVWEEWEAGIVKDKCLGQIYRTHQVQAQITEEYLSDIRRDARMILAAIEKPQPRQRETCESCMFLGYCHGGESERRQYGTREGVRNLSHA